MSFSYYLSHSLTIKFLTLFAPAVAIAAHSAVGFWLMVPATFALSLIPAVAWFLAVEKRAWNWWRSTPAQDVPRSLLAAA